MEFKKLISLLVITTFTGQTITGCVGNYNNANSSTSTQNTNTVTATDSLTDHRIWANITGYDSVSKDSQLNFSINNASQNSVQLVGCDNDSTITNHLESSIEIGAIAQRTKKFDNQWLAYANSDGSMLDPKHVTDNYIYFKGDNSSNRTYNCYYRIYHPEVNSFIYVKLVTSEVTLPTNGAGTRGQPDIDIEQLSNTDVGEAVKSGKLSLSSYSKPLAWSDQKNIQQSLINYTDKIINAGVRKRLNEMNQSLLVLHAISSSKQVNSLGGDDDDPFNAVQAKDSLDEILKQGFRLENGGVDILPYIENVTNNNGDFIFKMKGNGLVDGRTYDLSKLEDVENFEKDYGVKVKESARPNRVPNARELSNQYVEEVGKEPSNPADLFEENSIHESYFEEQVDEEVTNIAERGSLADNSMRSLQADIDRGGAGELENVFGSDVRAVTADTSRATTAGGMLALPVAVGVLVIVAVVELAFWIQDLVNRNAGKGTNGKGNTKSNVVMLKLTVPSASDINSWNATHDQLHRLGDTTTAVAIDPSDVNGGNNSITQTMRFTFKNDKNGRDLQLGNQISLNSISTPWIRGYSKQDPFVGDVSEGSLHQTDAVVSMSINDLSHVDEVKDAGFAYNNQRLANLGVSSLAQDLRFDAPTYNVQSITNTKTDNAIYKAGSNGGLFAIRNGLARINGIDGLVVNSGQQTTLSIQIPTSSLSRLQNAANSGALSYGQGLGSNLVSYDDNDATTLTPVKSDAFLRHLQSVPESAVGSYFYNKFNCSYPLKVGDKCTFTMEAGGNMDGKKHLQKLYLADGNSKTTAIPVYVNYNLVSEPQSIMLSNGDNSPVKIVVKNFSNDPYTQIKVYGLPIGARLLSNSDGMPSCSSQLSAQQSCELSYDFSNVDSGTYSMVIYGLTGDSNSGVPSRDSANANGFNLTIQGGF